MSLLERLYGLFGAQAAPAPALVDRADADGTVPQWPTRRDSLYNPLTGMGGDNDKSAASRPNLGRIALTDQELQTLYAYNGVARRIVDVLPQRATRRGWACPGVPPAEEQRLSMFARVRDAMAMGRLYGDAVLLMVTEDDVPPAYRRRPEEWLEQPLDPERVGRVAALHVFDAWEARPMLRETNVRSPNYRQPSVWALSAEGWSARVHASRVVVFRGARRPPSDWRTNYLPDASVLQAVWDEIRRLADTMASGAVLAQELRQNVLRVEGLANKLASDEAEALQRRIGVMQRTLSLLGIAIIGEGDDYQTKSTPATGFRELSEGAQMMLATALGWPRSMLTGEAPGGLSTDDNAGLERERQIVSSYQEDNREEIEQLYRAIYAAQDGPTGGEVPDEWALAFAPLDEPGEREVAEVRKLVAETDAIYITSGVYGPEDVARGRFGEEGWSLDLDEVEVPDGDVEGAIEAGRLALEAELAAGAQQEPEDDPQPRDDAAPGTCWIGIAAADPELRVEVQRAIGQPLVVDEAPHVTVLYLGAVAGEDVGEVVRAAQEAAEDADVSVLDRARVTAFPHGPHGQPVVVEFGDGWQLDGLHHRLLRRLAHLVSARQHSRFRPHLTLGYAAEPLDNAAWQALAEVDASEVRVPVAVLEVRYGGELVATVPLGEAGA